MKTFAAAVVILLASSTHLSAQNSTSLQNGKRLQVQPACASVETGKGEGKFTGQIYSAAAGSFQVAAGKETATVSYNNTLLVCENGQISTTGALLPGASVEVIGPMSKRGNTIVFTATKVLVSGAAPAPANPPQGQDNFNQGGVNGSNTRGSSPGSGTYSGQGDDSIKGGIIKGNTLGNGGNAITCNSLQFEVGGTSGSGAIGAGAHRTTVTPITCRRTVDQETMEFLQDATTGKRLASVTLSWQGTLTVTLTNADISSVTFAYDTTGQIVEIAFASERAEIVHSPSGTKVTY
jgi:type VI protein secretion system component Hcp